MKRFFRYPDAARSAGPGSRHEAMRQFRAKLEPVPHGGCFVVVPPSVATAAGLKYRDRVRGSVNGVPYRSSLMKYSGVFHMGVHKATLIKAGVGVGDDVRVRIERDPELLPTDTVPPDLARALRANPRAAAAFARLTPSHRREYVGFVIEAKRPETRARRVAKTVAALTGSSAGSVPRPVQRAPRHAGGRPRR